MSTVARLLVWKDFRDGVHVPLMSAWQVRQALLGQEQSLCRCHEVAEGQFHEPLNTQMEFHFEQAACRCSGLEGQVCEECRTHRWCAGRALITHLSSLLCSAALSALYYYIKIEVSAHWSADVARRVPIECGGLWFWYFCKRHNVKQSSRIFAGALACRIFSEGLSYQKKIHRCQSICKILTD